MLVHVTETVDVAIIAGRLEAPNFFVVADIKHMA